VQRVAVREYDDGSVREREDRLATEEPLEIRLGWPGHPPARLNVTMRTPGHDFELVAGFLHGEGIIEVGSDLHTVSYCLEPTLSAEQQWNVVTASLAGLPRRAPPARYAGPTGSAAGSACGVCGKESIDEVLAPGDVGDLRQQWPGTTVWPHVLAGLPETLRAGQRLFDRTGGVHAAGLFDIDGDPVAVREDVGRHNALDKVIGSRLLSDSVTEQVPPLLCVSGRIGFELVQKAVVAGVCVIAAVGAPSSLAVDLAAAAGLCVVGFVRDRRFVVYTAPERVAE